MNAPANQNFSQEYLHAFVDGELTAGERESALAQLESNPDFKSRVCEIKALKEQVKGAYAELPGTMDNSNFQTRPNRWWASALAAGLLLTLGLGGGWLVRGSMDRPPALEHLAGLPSGYQPVSLSRHVDPDKVLLHLDSSETGRLGVILDLAEKMLRERQGHGQLAIIVSTSGLDMLRQDISPVRGRIAQLSSEYPNLSFIVCGQTISRLKREGVDVLLVPEANVAPSAISEILSRMQRGWVYVKV